jgi:CubicO group peptidase (beta-lactamase class C family)
MSLQKRLDDLAVEWGFNGTVSITKEGVITAHGAYGFADEENNLPFTENTNCYIASVTKQFTAVCIMMLYEKKLLDIDDKLDKYIPEYSHAGEVTLRQLLNMVSGIPHELEVIFNQVNEKKEELGLSDRDFEVYHTKACAPEKCSFEDFLQLVNPLPLNSIPGTKFEYSDTNYMLLGEVVARVSSKPLGKFMEEYILKPLGMDRTILGADYSDAVSYMVYEGEYICLGRAHFKTGDGSICTTALDLAKWLTAVAYGRLLKKSSWRQIFKMVDGYGFGWGKVGEWYTHSGNDLGYYSYVYVNIEEKLSIAIVGNHEMPVRDVLCDITFQRNVRRAVSAQYTTLQSPKLVKLNEDNVTEVLSMRTAPEQRGFVAENYYSIAQAYVDRNIKPFAVMDGNTVVGFLAMVFDRKDKDYWILRLLIDGRYQKKGYGRAACSLGIQWMKEHGAPWVKISFEPKNMVAEKLYRSLGFNPTGQMEDDEIVYKMDL